MADDSPAGNVTDATAHLLVVRHSRTGTTDALCDAAVRGAREAAGDAVVLRDRRAFDAASADVTWANAVLLATPANFGYMSGALKDFFERIYHPCLGHTDGLPYAVLVKGDTDVEGALASVERIATGLRWRRVLAPVAVVGAAGPTDHERAAELGATLAAGLEAGIF